MLAIESKNKREKYNTLSVVTIKIKQAKSELSIRSDCPIVLVVEQIIEDLSDLSPNWVSMTSN